MTIRRNLANEKLAFGEPVDLLKIQAASAHRRLSIDRIADVET